MRRRRIPRGNLNDMINFWENEVLLELRAIRHNTECYPLHEILHRLDNLNKKADTYMATIEERFTAINTRLDEASTELLALIETLRNQGVTPAAEAVLVQIEAKANALADIVPNVPPAP